MVKPVFYKSTIRDKYVSANALIQDMGGGDAVEISL